MTDTPGTNCRGCSASVRLPPAEVQRILSAKYWMIGSRGLPGEANYSKPDEGFTDE